MAETAERRHQELLVQADLVAVAESVATAETATTVLAHPAQTVVAAALPDLVVSAARPRREWLDRVVLAVLAAMAETADKAEFLATAVTLATLDLVVSAGLAVMRRLEPTALMDLADEPEMVATAEMVETETYSPAQAPTAAMVETAATQEQQAPEALTDSPATAATVVLAATAGIRRASFLTAVSVATAETAEQPRVVSLEAVATAETADLALTALQERTQLPNRRPATDLMEPMVVMVAMAEPAEPRQLVPVAPVVMPAVPGPAETVGPAETDLSEVPKRRRSELERAMEATALLVAKVGPAVTPDSAELMAMVATVAMLVTAATAAMVVIQPSGPAESWVRSVVLVVLVETQELLEPLAFRARVQVQLDQTEMTACTQTAEMAATAALVVSPISQA